MKYISTRGHADRKSFCEILLEGLAPDGGLYLPEHYPQLDSAAIDQLRSTFYTAGYAGLAFALLSLYIDDIPPADLKAICDRTYTPTIFGTPEIVPLRPLETGLFLEELSNGPTLAFKDMAMQLLGNLFEYELARRGEKLNILGATSGDTGSAAEYAMRGKKGVNVFMTSPKGRMSAFQQAQMFSLQDANIHNIAIDGVFDDCQDIVKAVSNDLDFKKKYRIGTVNSINWARLMAQVVYYFAGYFQATNIAPTLVASRTALPLQRATLPEAAHLKSVQVRSSGPGAAAFSPEGGSVRPEVSKDAPADWQSQIRGPGLDERGSLPLVSFAVPSGNFGNVCAGHVARMMGLPIDRLVVATNENNVLEEFFRTGVYRVRTSANTHETSSPSMDISKASNFERFVFDLLGRDAGRTRSLFHDQILQAGQFDLSGDASFSTIAACYGFVSGVSTHADRLATIRSTYKRFNSIIDTHTADGLKVAREFVRPGVPMIVLETALPIKFAETIQEALGQLPPRPAGFEGIEQLPKRLVVLQADAATIKRYIAENVQ